MFGSAAAPIKVQVTGMALADAKDQVVMCPPFAVSGVGTVGQTPTPDCQEGVPTSGIDLAVVTFPGHNSTHRWGETHIEAMWNGSSLKVLSQRLPAKSDDDDPLPPDGVPCAAPAGGWKLGATQDDPAVGKVEKAVGADFGMLQMGYPHGYPKNASSDLSDTEQVLVVGVTGDQVAATAAIRQVFSGNLCVVHSNTTGSEVTRQNDVIVKAWQTTLSKSGIMSISQHEAVEGTLTNEIEVIVDTPLLEHVVATTPGPAIVLRVWIKPLR